MSNRLGAPAYRPSRRKFQEALACLKGILRVNSHPAAVKLRATELLLACYGVEYPGSGLKRDLVSVKTLMADRNFEEQLQKQIAQNLAAQTELERVQKADAQVAAIFHEVLHRPELDLVRRSGPEAEMV